MNRLLTIFIGLFCVFIVHSSSFAQETAQEKTLEPENNEYTIGAADMLIINILQPDKMSISVTVAPDGAISFPYIGRIYVKGTTLNNLQNEIQTKLSNGYLKYPVVSVYLEKSLSRKFFVYGEVNSPGTYQLDSNTTILKAISMAGGFNQFGSSSHIKILRERNDKPGYELIKVKIKDIMSGKADIDIVLLPGDIVVVSEGIF